METSVIQPQKLNSANNLNEPRDRLSFRPLKKKCSPVSPVVLSWRDLPQTADPPKFKVIMCVVLSKQACPNLLQQQWKTNALSKVYKAFLFSLNKRAFHHPWASVSPHFLLYKVEYPEITSTGSSWDWYV